LKLAGDPVYVECRTKILEFLYARHRAPAAKAA